MALKRGFSDFSQNRDKNKTSSIYHYTGSLTYEDLLRMYEEAY